MTRKQIRDNVYARSRETGIDDIVNNLINQTLSEIQIPGWAYSGRREHHYLWNFNKRKTTLTTATSTEDYQLPRDIDKIAIVRQVTSPVKLVQVPDRIFYRLLPYPTASGNPLFYRLWEELGTSVQLAADDMVSVVSDNTADGSTFYVSIIGYTSADGIKVSEQITLNGTTTVDGTITFKSDKPLLVSKSGITTGSITIKGKTTPFTTLLTLGKQDISARFKRISFYPIPSSAITIYLEYFTRIRNLMNDYDSPDFDEKWHWVVEEGTLSKIYEYKEDDARRELSFNRYKQAVMAMIEADSTEYDYIPHLSSQAENRIQAGIIETSDGSYSAYF